MSKKALHTTPIEATKDELHLELEKILRPLLDPLIAEVKDLRVAVSISGKSKFLTMGQIKKEFGLPKSAVLKFQSQGLLTAFYLNPVRFEREALEKLVQSRKLFTTKMSAV